MTIANPIYDIVFKYLLEDLDIAKGLLSAILDTEIAELSVQPQETVSETPQETKPIRIYRIDFAATLTPKDGKPKKVLIELQKTKRNTNAQPEEFVRLLTHESYFIQIPKLVEPTKTRLEKILSVFNQTFKTADEHALDYKAPDDGDPLLQKMLTRLTRAIADEQMRRKMNIEDEIEREFEEYQNTIEQKDEELRQSRQVIEQSKQVIEQKDQLIESLKRQLAEQSKQSGDPI